MIYMNLLFKVDYNILMQAKQYKKMIENKLNDFSKFMSETSCSILIHTGLFKSAIRF